ncbi:glycolate oxidase subunit GlcE [Paenalcaligenes suwonensis]|uniref:glycolate oxidase subunit GlcE n=1 Tax=Paenalcaligenes suwonensis TaxID=1202713 RepID=UPI001F62578B|nr:glycolate oxidase subunit GlcE [Paenalcaligenes suwonensis]
MTTTHLIKDWQEQLAQATANHTPLQLCGSGSKNFYGPQAQGQVLDLRANQGVVDYEPSELVMVVKGGTRLSEVEAMLAERNQCLAFEPPHFGPEATIAGCIAAGLSGPRRANAGGLKDFVLGVKIVDGLGQHLSFGGQVMKNVAGYDVSRVIAGSFGSLGVIDELSIKVLPIPERTLTLRLNLTQDKALDLFNTLGGQPVAISATAWFNDQAYIRLSGAPEALLAGKNALVVTSCLRQKPQNCGHTFVSSSTSGSSVKTRAICGVCRCLAPRLSSTVVQMYWWNGAARCAGSSAPLAKQKYVHKSAKWVVRRTCFAHKVQ